eukprot:4170260-Pyramimonas_sp.AAC.1
MRRSCASTVPQTTLRTSGTKWISERQWRRGWRRGVLPSGSGAGNTHATRRLGYGMRNTRDVNVVALKCSGLSASCLLYTSPSPRDRSLS